MTERPILFSAPMVRALRENRKTQTRRTSGLDAVNESPSEWEYLRFEHGYHRFRHVYAVYPDIAIRSPYGLPGDRLWTREAWITLVEWDALPPRIVSEQWARKTETFPIWYCADGVNVPDVSGVSGKVRPGMFLPRRFSRDLLEVISDRPEPLKSITDEDAIAEGVIEWRHPESGAKHFGLTVADVWESSAVAAYRRLWGDINGPEVWAKNPWVWRVEFRRLS